MDERTIAGAVPARRVATPKGRSVPRVPVFATPGALLVLFIVVPLVGLVWRAVTAPDFLASLAKPIVVDALRLTAVTSGITVLVALVTGTPLAYLLARRAFPGKWLMETIVDIPLVLPPVVAGVALLIAFGRRGLLGAELSALGIEIPFTTAAVVMAQIFVGIPFYIRSARVGFMGVDPSVEEAAAIDGASAWRTFRDVTLPLALPGIISGIVLCWARALSEFGATLMFAGNFIGRTQTMPLAIMSAMESDLTAALALSVLLIAVSGVVLILSQRLAGGRGIE